LVSVVSVGTEDWVGFRVASGEGTTPVIEVAAACATVVLISGVKGVVSKTQHVVGTGPLSETSVVPTKTTSSV